MKTRIYCKYPGQTEHLINEIEATSKFTNTKWPKDLDPYTKEAQMVVAEDIVNGWKMHGGKPVGSTFRIDQSDFKPRSQV